MKPFESGNFLVRLLDKSNEEELHIVQKLRYDFLLRDFDPRSEERRGGKEC